MLLTSDYHRHHRHVTQAVKGLRTRRTHPLHVLNPRGSLPRDHPGDHAPDRAPGPPGRPGPRQRGGNGRHRPTPAGPALIDKQTVHAAPRRPLHAFLSPRFVRRALPFSTPQLRSQTPPLSLVPPTSLSLLLLPCSLLFSSSSSRIRVPATFTRASRASDLPLRS